MSDSEQALCRILPFGERQDISVPTSLTNQFQEVFDTNFDVRRLRDVVADRDIGRISLATLRSFVADDTTLAGQRAVYKNTFFTPRCVPDYDGHSEAAGYELRVPDDDTAAADNIVNIEVSPRAIRVVYNPMSLILEEHDVSVERKVAFAYKSVFAGVVSQAVMKMAMRNDDFGFDERYINRIDALYESKFAESADDITDPAVRLNRVAMCVGGAVMLRQAASGIEGSGEGIRRQTDITQKLRFFALGLASSAHSITDQQQVSFALAHAYTPKQTAQALKYWFSPL